jgi:ribonuclease E
LRLRDLAGLIVIDFIDMDEKRNNRAVERKMSDCLRQDRARIQVGRISHFGLLEMSRQRIRASVLESSTEPCPHCGGSGHVRSVASVALQLLRGLEENLMKGATHNLTVRTRTDVALYVLNHKRGHLRDLENGFQIVIAVSADPTITGQQSFVIERGEQVHTLEAAKAILAARSAALPVEEDDLDDEDFIVEEDVEFEGEDVAEAPEAEAEGETEARAEGEEGPGRRRRRRRRRGRGGENREQPAQTAAQDGVSSVEEVSSEGEDDSEEETESNNGQRADQADGERRPRRRGRRGGRRRRGNGGPEEGLAASIADDLGPADASEVTEAAADLDASPAPTVSHQPAFAPPAAPAPQADAESEADGEDKPAPRRSTVREKVSFFFGDSSASANNDAESAPQAAPAAEPEAEKPEAAQPNAPRRAGWWSRRSE